MYFELTKRMLLGEITHTGVSLFGGGLQAPEIVFGSQHNKGLQTTGPLYEFKSTGMLLKVIMNDHHRYIPP